MEAVEWSAEDYMKRIRELEAEVERLRELIKEALRDLPQAHYTHHDPQGTAGAHCPACINQREAGARIRAALEPREGEEEGR